MEVSFPDFHAYPRLQLGFRSFARGHSRIVLHAQPGVHSIDDSWTGHRQANTLDLLGLTVSIDAATGASRLEEINYFAQRSLVPMTWLASQMSWQLALKTVRGGVDGPNRTHTMLGVGVGTALRTWGRSMVFTLATVDAMGSSRGANVAPGVTFGALAPLDHRVRAGIHVDWLRGVRRGSESFARLNAWLRWDVTRGKSLGVTWAHTNFERGIELSLRWGI